MIGDLLVYRSPFFIDVDVTVFYFNASYTLSFGVFKINQLNFIILRIDEKCQLFLHNMVAFHNLPTNYEKMLLHITPNRVLKKIHLLSRYSSRQVIVYGIYEILATRDAGTEAANF